MIASRPRSSNDTLAEELSDDDQKRLLCYAVSGTVLGYSLEAFSYALAAFLYVFSGAESSLSSVLAVLAVLSSGGPGCFSPHAPTTDTITALAKRTRSQDTVERNEGKWTHAPRVQSQPTHIKTTQAIAGG